VKPDPAGLVAAAAAQLGLALSSAQIGLLQRYADLLRSRAVPLGLISEKDRDRILVRHVLDSLRGAGFVEAADQRAYDMGSGAGLPGIAVGIARPDLIVELVESRRTRAGFLEMAVDELAIQNALVRWARIEELAGPVDLCFARAFGSVERSWEAAKPLLRPGGRLVHFVGASRGELPELAGASSTELRPVPLLDSAGALAIITR